ncbi:hypothetical protein [Paraburkholderia sp. BL23I1N1]|uniref:hypothetical protein n=1 Tax=Paraburkholderia sp. BL23I1N1 TaxID=1938802 RepID=UPI000E70F600|nr:hypothetical protein [Paraburkholderia sp. BL23I1N1]
MLHRAVWYAIGKTVSDAATRSSDPEEFWKQFSLYSREMAKMMRCETWPIFETPAGNLPEMTGESKESPVIVNQQIPCKFK